VKGEDACWRVCVHRMLQTVTCEELRAGRECMNRNIIIIIMIIKYRQVCIETFA